MPGMRAADVVQEARAIAGELRDLAKRMRVLRARAQWRTTLSDTLRDFAEHAERGAERLDVDVRYYAEEAEGAR